MKVGILTDREKHWKSTYFGAKSLQGQQFWHYFRCSDLMNASQWIVLGDKITPVPRSLDRSKFPAQTAQQHSAGC